MKKKFTKMTKSILSFALAAAMVMGMSGTTSLAAEGDTESVGAQTIIVKEQVNGTADTSFDYHIYQITEANTPIETMDDIISSVPGAGLSYTIYDTYTGEELDTETTDEYGGFSLSAEEYAEFIVAAQTDWYVFQDTPDEYPLTEVTADGSCASVVDNTNGVVQHTDDEDTSPTDNTPDKSALKAEYDADILLSEDDYTPESWEPFEEALEKAKEVLDNSDATQEEVDQALEDLEKAKENLEKSEPAQTVDKSALREEYDADALLDESDYTPESWEPFKEALDKAQEVLNDEDATQEEVDEALADLQETKDGLKEPEKVDKTALQTEYDADITLKESDYTPESWEPFADAMEQAKDVLDNGEATQDEVDEALKDLQEAKEALEKVSEPEPEPGQPTASVTVTASGLEKDNTKHYDGYGVTLTAEAEGSEGATLTYQWYLYDEEHEAFREIEGATESTYTLEGNVSDSGMYECVVTATNEGLTATAEAAITITIEKAEQAISYAETLIEKMVGDEPFTNELTEMTVDTEGGATITYASSEEKIAEVDPETGVVTIHTDGTVVITATAAGTANYAEATATYVIEISKGKSEPTVDKDALREEYDADSELIESDYTPESWATFAAAMEQAKDVLADEDATQEAVDEALAVLQSAREGLQKVPEPGQPTVSDVTITTSVGDTTKSYDGAGFNLSVSAEVEPEDADVTYEWYKEAEDGSWTLLTGERSVFTTGSNVSDSGTYKCVVTATNEGLTATADAEIEITITKADQKIVFTTESVELAVGATYTNPLTSDSVTVGKITYESDNEKVAEVNAETGEVTIVGLGTAHIIATAEATDNYNGTSNSYTITTNDPGLSVEVSSDLDENEKTYNGEPVTLTAEAKSSVDGATFTYQWYKDDGTGKYEPVSDVSTENTLPLAGNVSDSGSYRCEVTVTYPGGETGSANGTIEITINKDEQKISYNEKELTKVEGGEDFTNPLTQTKVDPADGSGITYSISAENGESADEIATVDATTGLVTIVGPGTVTVTATAAATDNYEKATASYTLTIEQKLTIALTVTAIPEKTTYDKDGGITFSAIANVEPSEAADSLTYQWYKVVGEGKYEKVENKTDNSFTITDVLDSGTYLCVVTATYGTQTVAAYGTATATITKAQQDISYAVETVEKTVGGDAFTNELTQTLVDFNGGAKVTYSISGENADEIATIDPGTGEVKILGEGTVTVTATASATDNYEAATASYTLTITAAGSEPQPEPEPGQPTVSVTITSTLTDNTKTYDGVGVSLTAAATVEPEDAEVSYQWYTVAEDGTEIAIEGATYILLNIDGNVVDSGTYKCVVTATNDGMTATAEDKITITIETAEQEISYRDGVVSKNDYDKDFTNPLIGVTYGALTYTSSNESVATVDADGTVHIIGVGYTAIVVTVAGDEEHGEYPNYTGNYADYMVFVNSDEVQWEIDVNHDQVTWDEEKEEWVDDLSYTGEPLELEMVITLTDEEKEELEGITYQWYRFVPGINDYEAIEGATEATYTLEDEDVNVGDYIYMCMAVVTYKNGYSHPVYSPIEVIIEKAQQEISYEETEIIKVDGGESFVNELTETKVDTIGGAVITYESSEQSVATVDAYTGVVTILGPGETVITATVPETGNYKAATASYTLTVEKKLIVSVEVTSPLTDNTKPYDGSEVSLTATATVEPEDAEVSYQWYTVAEDGTETAIEGATYILLNIGGNVVDSGTYKCVVTAEYGTQTVTAEAEITITIEKAQQDISYADTEIKKTDMDNPFTNVLTETTVSEEEGAGITYTSSDTTIATVDEDGLVTILTYGEVTITATAAETANYAEAVASYTLVVTEGYNVRYAVSIYGINQDADADGNILGLTFGPATGERYTNTYKAHLTEEQYDAGEEGICLHWMSWDEIIAQSEKDPTVFEDCLENGCTHSVNIKLNDTVLSTDYSGKMDNGDGVGILGDSIKQSYRKWNSSNTNAGGWPASRMRATLNGADEWTQSSIAGDDTLDGTNCLLTCFPEELQNAIVAKAVKSDTVYDNQSAANNVTTYDKLWLFSGKELYGSGSMQQNLNVIRTNEGRLYQRSKVMGITTDNYGKLANYNETNDTSRMLWWLRSLTRTYDNYIYYVVSSGTWSSAYANNNNLIFGLAPGFCLAGPDKSASITLTLTDPEEGTPLAGGTFALYCTDSNGEVEQVADGLVTDENGQITVNNCTAGTYYFVETEAPDGYILPDQATSDTVTVPAGLTEVAEYTVTMENTASAVRYAVKIWGIQQDTYSYDGGETTDTAGLTFGPAWGKNYLDSYVSRETVIANGGTHDSAYCIHDMTWNEIIAQSKEDPTVFADCKKNGCTKSVKLNLNDTLGNQTTIENCLDQEYTGDGVSTLYYLLNGTGNFRGYTQGANWNYTSVGFSDSDMANIYSRSRIRTTLTGDSTDAKAQVEAGCNDYYDVETLCDENTCLFSCFPEELQEAVVPRTTINTGATAGTSAHDKTTYDKLFLFAFKEVGLLTSYDDTGGVDYGVNSTLAYEFSDISATASSSQQWWSRSRTSSLTYYAFYVMPYESGTRTGSDFVYNNKGLSPGFCIK